MKTTLDREGRIALGPELQRQLGVEPGDEILLENRGSEWVIKAAKSATGLCLEGNVLVHRGISLVPNPDPLATVRDERFEQLTRGLPQ